MIAETKKSTYVEVTNRIEATLVARCSDSDFIYEIESLRQLIDNTSLPIKQSIRTIVTLRSTEDHREFLTLEAEIRDLEVRLDFVRMPKHYFFIIDEQFSNFEMKERMLKAFNDYSSFNLEFSIES